MKVLGIDPGFANFGWCVATVSPDGSVRPIDCGVIKTKKSHKKLKVLSPDDEFRRIGELSDAFDRLVMRNQIRMVCAEGMSSPRNAATIRMLGYSWGIVGSWCQRFQIPLAQISPKQLKKALCGRISTTDVELHTEVRRRFPGYQALVDCINATTLHEHAYDALAAIEACRPGQVFRTLIANLRNVA